MVGLVVPFIIGVGVELSKTLSFFFGCRNGFEVQYMT